MSLKALLSMGNTFTGEDEPGYRTAKNPCGEISVRRKIRTAKTLYDENSLRHFAILSSSLYKGVGNMLPPHNIFFRFICYLNAGNLVMIAIRSMPQSPIATTYIRH